MVELSKENKSDCFFENYGNDFDQYYRDPSIQRIMAKSASRYAGSFNPDEVGSIKAEWLWHSIRKFDKDKFPNTKFSSYLFGQIGYGFKTAIKKRKRDRDCPTSSDYGGQFKWAMPSDRVINYKDWRDAKDFIMDLPNGVRSILKQRFIECMTMDEIGAKNGYSRETARRKINSAIEFCKTSD